MANFGIQHDHSPPEVRSPQSAALDLQTDERHRDAEAAG
jgi:hypothetical protein